MIDRVVHHADVLTLEGASFRLRNPGIDTLTNIRNQAPADLNPTNPWPRFRPPDRPHIQGSSTHQAGGSRRDQGDVTCSSDPRPPCRRGEDGRISDRR
jgi:hypothetical protein